MSCVSELCKSLFVRTGDAENSGEYQKDLLTGYVGVRIKRGIAGSGKRTHLIGLGNRKIEPIVCAYVGKTRDIGGSGCAEGTGNECGKLGTGKRLIGLNELAFVADIKPVFDSGGHGILGPTVREIEEIGYACGKCHRLQKHKHAEQRGNYAFQLFHGGSFLPVLLYSYLYKLI